MFDLACIGMALSVAAAHSKEPLKGVLPEKEDKHSFFDILSAIVFMFFYVVTPIAFSIAMGALVYKLMCIPLRCA